MPDLEMNPKYFTMATNNYTALCSPSARGRHKMLTEHTKPETLTLPLVVHAPHSHLLSLGALCGCCSWVWSTLSSVRKSSSACNVNDFVEVISNRNVQLPVHPHQDRLHWGQACSHLKGVVKGVPFRGHVQVQRRWHVLQNLLFK